MPRRLLLLLSMLFPAVCHTDELELGDADGLYRPASALIWEDASDPNSLDVAGARAIRFPPYSWLNNNSETDRVWYQVEIPPEMVSQAPLGILINRVYASAHLYLNGDLIGPDEAFSGEQTRLAHRPLFISLSASDLQQPENRLQIEHRGYPGFGYFMDLRIGAAEAVYQQYRTRYFWQQRIPELLFYLQLLSGLFIFWVWWSNREQREYLIFALSAICLSVFTLNQFWQRPWLNDFAWLVLTHTSVDWWAVFACLFVHYRAGLHMPRLRNTLLAFLPLAPLYYLSLPLPKLPGSSLVHLVSLSFVALHLLLLVYRPGRIKQNPSLVAYFSMLVAVSIHDLLMQTGVWSQRWLEGYFMLAYVAPVSGLLIASQLIGEYSRTRRQLKAYSQRLEQRVEQARFELEHQFKLLQQAGE